MSHMRIVLILALFEASGQTRMGCAPLARAQTAALAWPTTEVGTNNDSMQGKSTVRLGALGPSNERGSSGLNTLSFSLGRYSRLRGFNLWFNAEVLAGRGQDSTSATNSRKGTANQSEVPILIHPDLNCILRVDGEKIGLVKKDESKVVRVNLGEHLLEADSEVGGLHWERVVEVKENRQLVITIPLQAIANASAANRAATDAARQQAAQLEAENEKRKSEELNKLTATLQAFVGSWRYEQTMNDYWSAECKGTDEFVADLTLREVDVTSHRVVGSLDFSRESEVTKDTSENHDCHYRLSGSPTLSYSEQWDVEIVCTEFQCTVNGTRTSCSGDCPETWDKTIGQASGRPGEDNYFFVRLEYGFTQRVKNRPVLKFVSRTK